jgi:putative FmdB family regulatory protein
MPTYEYRCQACSHFFEGKYTISERKTPESNPCPECGEVKVLQVIETAPELGDAVRMGVKRPDKGWSEVLQKIHARNPGSQIKKTARYFD